MKSSHVRRQPHIAGVILCCMAIAAALLSKPLPADEPLPIEQADISPRDLDFFEQHVRPLFIEHCYECHAEQEQSGSLRLDSRVAWQAGGDSGPLLVVGQPDQSRLIEAIRYENLELQMPPSGKLSAAQIAALEQWVAMGAPDPRDAPVPSDTAEGATSHAPVRGMSVEAGREFWSFRPLSNPQVPSPRDTTCQRWS